MTGNDTSAAEAPRRLAFYGAGGALLGIHVVNVFLTLLTLGPYYFWGKVRVRRYVFGQTELDGDRFGFHGRGGELALGFVKAMFVFGVPLLALQWLPALLDAGTAVTVAASLVAYAIALVFVSVARIGARRYRLSRTSWRGVRFSFRGAVGPFVGLFVRGWLLTAATAGLYYPFFATSTHAFLVRHSYFGSAAFDFDGDGRDLFADFVYAVLLTLPTLGFCWFWFVARKRRYFWEHTTFREARFHSTVTGGRLLALMAGNLLLIVLSLGLAWPFATVRNARFVCATLTLAGAANLALVEQDAQMGSATAEGLLGFLEADLDLV